ncbi:MAG: hypothetical protein FWH36_02945 [Lentimicrobiaceae bacterium]|nr:hypothetical protein [Lentimicrobiaceae bacterium]
MKKKFSVKKSVISVVIPAVMALGTSCGGKTGKECTLDETSLEDAKAKEAALKKLFNDKADECIKLVREIEKQFPGSDAFFQSYVDAEKGKEKVDMVRAYVKAGKGSGETAKLVLDMIAAGEAALKANEDLVKAMDDTKGWEEAVKQCHELNKI